MSLEFYTIVYLYMYVKTRSKVCCAFRPGVLLLGKAIALGVDEKSVVPAGKIWDAQNNPDARKIWGSHFQL